METPITQYNTQCDKYAIVLLLPSLLEIRHCSEFRTMTAETVIPRNVRVSEAPSYGKPVLLYDLKCIGSQAYLRLASEIIQREKAANAA